MATDAETDTRLLIVTGAVVSEIVQLPPLIRSLISSASDILVDRPGAAGAA
jgi:hypothetical protein